MFFPYVILCGLASMLMVFRRVDAITSEEKLKIHEAMEPYVSKCIAEFGVSEEKVAEVKKKGNADDVDPCFMACVFHKIGIINNKGLYDVEKALDITKPFISNEEDIKNIEKVANICAKVNDDEVSDGDKGCDRSKLVFACMIDHKDEINLNLD